MDFIDFGHCIIRPAAVEIRAVDVQNAVVANRQDWDFRKASTPPKYRNLDKTVVKARSTAARGNDSTFAAS
jgi:hypothetical protein